MWWLWDVHGSDVTAALVFALTLGLVYLNTRRSPRVPPGPPLWPVIGNLPAMAGNPLDALVKLRRQYGDVIGLYFGSELTVVVSGYDAIHEVLVKRGTQFAWRPETPFMRKSINYKCLVFANGALWKKNRNFTQNAFQKLCFNNQSLAIEEKITDELLFFVEKLSKMTGPVDLARDINFSLANVIFSILHGFRPGYTDKRLVWYLDLLQKAFTTFRRRQLLTDCFPFLLYLPIDVIGAKTDTWKNDKMLAKHFEAICLENYDTYVEGKEDCFVHHLITSFGVKTKDEWKAAMLNGHDSVWVLLHDLTAAGSETTATTINWIVLYLVREQEVQRRARDEVDRVIGRANTPALKHRKHMPYTEAIVLEGLRLGQVVPLGLPHSVSKDATIRGFHIPNNIQILFNMQSVLRDPLAFPDPDVFKPERFLSEDGLELVVPKEFLPFSRGPRSCLGESIARMELFLYTATLLQKFELVCPDGHGMPETSGRFGITFAPKPYKVNVVTRS